MKKYILTHKGVINTNITDNPHTECFHIIDNILYKEDILGNLYDCGEVIGEYDTLGEILANSNENN